MPPRLRPVDQVEAQPGLRPELELPLLKVALDRIRLRAPATGSLQLREVLTRHLRLALALETASLPSRVARTSTLALALAPVVQEKVATLRKVARTKLSHLCLPTADNMVAKAHLLPHQPAKAAPTRRHQPVKVVPRQPHRSARVVPIRQHQLVRRALPQPQQVETAELATQLLRHRAQATGRILMEPLRPPALASAMEESTLPPHPLARAVDRPRRGLSLPAQLLPPRPLIRAADRIPQGPSLSAQLLPLRHLIRAADHTRQEPSHPATDCTRQVPSHQAADPTRQRPSH